MDTGGFTFLAFLVLNEFCHKLSLWQRWFSGIDTAAEKRYSKSSDSRINIEDPLAAYRFVNALRYYLQQKLNGQERPIILLCIGSDRCTGDCLGPLTGSLLEEGKLINCKVYGTLKKPVHALNLKHYLKEIQTKYSRPFIIAIDAALGYSEDVGTVIISPEALRPGNGVNKALPPIGDICITGIVNDFQKLYSTRLYKVTNIANFIARGLQCVFCNKSEKMQEKVYQLSCQ